MSSKPSRLSRFAIIPVLTFLVFLGGCTTYYGSAAFNSEPAGVSIFDMEDGSVIGVTPVNYVWRSKDAQRKYMNIRVHKDGYQDAVKSFWLALDYNDADDAARNPQPVQFELIKIAE